jgi:hypothetical protein
MRYLQFSGLILAGLCLAALATAFVGPAIPARTASAADAERAAAKPELVEESDHEWMEYMFAPPFNRLKKALASESQDRAVCGGTGSARQTTGCLRRSGTIPHTP